MLRAVSKVICNTIRLNPKTEAFLSKTLTLSLAEFITATTSIIDGTLRLKQQGQFLHIYPIHHQVKKLRC